MQELEAALAKVGVGQSVDGAVEGRVQVGEEGDPQVKADGHPVLEVEDDGKGVGRPADEERQHHHEERLGRLDGLLELALARLGGGHHVLGEHLGLGMADGQEDVHVGGRHEDERRADEPHGHHHGVAVGPRAHPHTLQLLHIEAMPAPAQEVGRLDQEG